MNIYLQPKGCRLRPVLWYGLEGEHLPCTGCSRKEKCDVKIQPIKQLLKDKGFVYDQVGNHWDYVGAGKVKQKRISGAIVEQYEKQVRDLLTLDEETERPVFCKLMPKTFSFLARSGNPCTNCEEVNCRAKPKKEEPRIYRESENRFDVGPEVLLHKTYVWRHSNAPEIAAETIRLLGHQEKLLIETKMIFIDFPELEGPVPITAWECEHFTPNNLKRLIDQRREMQPRKKEEAAAK